MSDAKAPLSDLDFGYVRDLVRTDSAIVLEADKRYLVEARLTPVIRRREIDSLAVLVQQLRRDTDQELRDEVVEAMTTNETSFFRDRHPFEILKQKVLPDLLQKRSTEQRLRIWCAACSSGQEPYSIAMLLNQSFPQLKDWRVDILATDLSSGMIQRARTGTYNQFEVNRGLPAPLLFRYFEKSGAEWRVKENIRKQIAFREMNLITPWPKVTPWDIIFIRNVLIYFDPDTKRAILNKISENLRADGCLFLGAAETTININDQFRRQLDERVGCYQLVKPTKVAASAVSK